MLYTASYSFNTEVIDIAALAPTGKSMKEVKSFTGKAYDSMSLKRAWIYQIIKEFKVGKITADERNSNMKKNKLREDNFTAVAAADEEGCRQTISGLASVLC
jgi:hypothetical protein